MRISLDTQTIFYIIAGILYLFFSFRKAKQKREKAMGQRKTVEPQRPMQNEEEHWEDEKPSRPKSGFEAMLEELEKKLNQEVEPEPKPEIKREVTSTRTLSTSRTQEIKQTHDPLVHIEKTSAAPQDIYSIEYEPRKKIGTKSVITSTSVKSKKELPLNTWLKEKNNLKRAVILSAVLQRYEEE